jgi:phage terminase small subunit
MSTGKPVGGGGARHPNSLANLQPGAGAGDGGLQRARSHAGYAAIARDRLEQKTLEIFDALAADAPLRNTAGDLPRHDAAQVALLAQCMCRLDDVTANIRDCGVFVQRGRRKGQIRPVVELERTLRREAASYLDALGMTPASRAKLGVDLVRAASTMGDELDAARAARAAREAREGRTPTIDATAEAEA